jgi:ABC-type transport system involved in multi-copper enzyme maturation permease subunit
VNLNPTLLTTLWRQRLTSGIRMALIAIFSLVPLGAIAMAPVTGLAGFRDPFALILVIAGGAIGQDSSAGVLQLLFARPVRRSEYVLSRWIGVAALVSAIVVVQIALGSTLLAWRGRPPDPKEVLMMMADNVAFTVGLSAVIVMFSTFIGGIADLGLLLLSFLMTNLVSLIGSAAKMPALTRAAEELKTFLAPKLDLTGWVLDHGPVSWFAVVSYASSITLCLVIAIVVMNRKELSYASG